MKTGVMVRTAMLLSMLLAASGNALAHCDTLDGPVARAAYAALDTGNVNVALIWVDEEDETELRHAFASAQAVRKLSADAQYLADRYFLETLTRMHCLEEGSPYLGLQPAQLELSAYAADAALELESVEPVLQLVTGAMQEGIRRQFQQALTRKNFQVDNVSAGREYVKSYVELLQYIERLLEAAVLPVEALDSRPQDLAGGMTSHGGLR